MTTPQPCSNQPIRAQPFRAADDTAVRALTVRAPRPAYLAAVALAAVIATVIATVFAVLLALPRWTPPAATLVTPPVNAVTVPAAATAIVPASPATPSSGAEDQTPTARKTAQELLRAALAQQAQLVATQAETWARSDLHAAATTIAAGEKAYREDRYRAAQDRYRDALTALAALEARLPSVIAALIARGDQALAAGDSAAAEAAFAQVLAIRPQHPGASAGRARAANLDHVLALIGQAEGYEHLGAIDKARAAFKEARSLDDHNAVAAAGLARLEQGERAAQFQTVMAQGLTALARGDHGAARQAFVRADSLQPHSAEAAAALKQTANAAAAQEIRAALEHAQRAEHDEAWRDAARHYDAAIALDRDLLDAEAARRNAQVRADLDARLEVYRADPLSLITDSARADAAQLLTSARAVSKPGRRLTQQINAVDSALRLAHTPVRIALRSNGATAVSIESGDHLAPFSEHALELAPGRYLARGYRDGYRDVRVEFSIVPAAPAPTITIQCDEPLTTGRSGESASTKH